MLGVLQEIAANLIGPEEMAVFDRVRDEPMLQLVAAFGVDPEPHRKVSFETGLIGHCAASGRAYIAGDEPVPAGVAAEPDLTASIPLEIGDQVTGAIALFRLLLQQKSGIQALDRELFDLLGTHAATALYSSGLRPSPARGRGAGVPRDLDLEEVVTTFLDEAERALVALEASPDDAEAIATVFRVMHTIKGNAGSLGFPGVAELTHGLEDVLDRLRKGMITATPALVTAVLRSVDVLRRLLVPGAPAEQPLSAEDRLLLRQSLAQLQAGAPSEVQDEADRLFGELQGEEVEVDASVVDAIRDPLTHMVRNAVDHGIETPAEREVAGKEP